ncbi:DNA repair exonuclease [Giardia duodenalis]|uniref:DNA repair exonuclease n=1 Tax=Giardia intestinalis TaxID=5741 RepID=V6TQ69_GIAIN|nr:DNA repair exonuclease [Giardia intestinalis]
MSSIKNSFNMARYKGIEEVQSNSGADRCKTLS